MDSNMTSLSKLNTSLTSLNKDNFPDRQFFYIEKKNIKSLKRNLHNKIVFSTCDNLYRP